MTHTTTDATPAFSQIGRGTLWILFVLLAERLLETAFLMLHQTETGIPYGWEVARVVLSYFFISLVFWLNRNQLHTLNVDRSTFFIFVLVGFGYVFLLPFWFGIALGLILLLDLLAYTKMQFGLEGPHEQHRPVWLLMFLYIILDILRITLTGEVTPVTSASRLLVVAFVANPALVSFEEVIFRGMLWAFLRSLRLRDAYIIVVQTAVFWLAHAYYAVEKPIFFWLLIPLGGAILGLMVARSKSLTWAWVSHYVHNLLIASA